MVTGASSGIGRASAVALARQGATVAAVARRGEKLRDLADAIHADGGKAIVVEADVTDEEQARRAVTEVVEQTGQLDILLNNAGFGAMQPMAEANIADWQRMVDVNVMGVLHCTHAALPHLLAAAEGEQGVADVVTISSVAGRVTRVGNGVYAATKHAVGAFSDSLRQEVTGRGVRVGLVEPGMVRTELTESVSPTSPNPPENHEWLEAEDIADAVVYATSRPPRVSINEILVRPTGQQR
jgi:NADP-dependent 3-hydroxy acid dehydrogenase YdfG